jgi:hypothetical protein
MPIRAVTIKREGDFVKKDNIRAENLPWALSNSIRNLLLETNASSMPAKNAVKSNELIIK